MRSRYSAFVLANGDYLMATHHKSTRPIKEKKAIVKWAKSVQWLKLEILESLEKFGDNCSIIIELSSCLISSNIDSKFLLIILFI